MPKQSGLKIYRQLKDHPELKNIPVIIITAVNDSFKIFIDKLKEVEPPEGILNKPIDPQEILKVVRGILSN
jgi:CheY-like chemotaxis protein